MEEDLQPGVHVAVRGDRWVVERVTPFGGCTSVTLRGCGDANGDARRTLLAPFDRFRPVDAGSGFRFVRPRRWLQIVRGLAAAAHPVGALRGVAASGIDILPYQLEPALAVAAGATRLLIADAVGLGKTVQAGMILNELAAEASGSFRALIAAPAGLREQWVLELASRFALDATVAGAAWLGQTVRDMPAGVNPWILPGIYAASFDFLKRPEVLRPLEEVTWDVVIVDEAHNASLGTARRAAVHDLARRARRVLLLTATPHAGDAAQFEALYRIGADEADPPLLVFRRSRHDACGIRPRRTVLLPVRLSGAERRMHRRLEDYTARVCREARRRGDPAGRLAAIVLRKRALSSAASLALSAGKRLDLLAGAAVTPEHQLLLPLGEDDDLDDGEPEGVLAAPGLGDWAEERRLLRRIAAAAGAAAAHESKTRRLIRLLTRAREPAIVFTEYRDTLVRLGRVLAAAGLRACAIHGGLPPVERARILQDFNERGTLLLATDAAAEGLNLQSRCRMVVHFELPWSPARLEQRTGRVDRIGQHGTVHEVLLVARDTAERLVLAPLARRAARAHAALPGSSQALALLTESRVAAAVMDGTPFGVPDESTLPWPGIDPALQQAAETEALRLRSVRHWRTTGAQARIEPGRAPAVTLMRRIGRGRGATCIYAVSLRTAGGRVVHCELVALHDALALLPASSTVAATRLALAHWRQFREPSVRRVVLSLTAPGLAGAAARRRSALAALQRREEAIVRARPSAAARMVQAGLFDNRGVRSHEAHTRAAGALLAEAQRCLASLDSARHVSVSVELAAFGFGK